MKFFLVLALAVAVAVAVPVDPKNAETLSYKYDNIGVGPFIYGFETSDGKRVEESGVLTNEGTDNEAMEVRGSFSYPGPDGVTYTVEYTAGVGGFQARGAHLPVPVQA